jgi:hypothetical protein
MGESQGNSESVSGKDERRVTEIGSRVKAIALSSRGVNAEMFIGASSD